MGKDNMNDLLVSIIIPVYKVEKYLDQCVQSVVDQTYQKLQIILIDDGSPDNCPQKCDEWAKNDSRIEVIHKKNGGLSDARNAGLRKAKGEYIFFIDSDDWIKKDTINILVNAINENHCDMVIYRFAEFYRNDDIKLSPAFEREQLIVNKKKYLSQILEDKVVTSHVWRRLYKKSKISPNIFPVGKNFEDIYTAPEFVKNCTHILEINYVGYYYRQNKNGIVKNYNLKSCEDHFIAIKNAKKEINKLEPSLQQKSRIMSVEKYFVILRNLRQLDIKNYKAKVLINEIIKEIKIQKIKLSEIFKYIKRNKLIFWIESKFPILLTNNYIHKVRNICKKK